MISEADFRIGCKAFEVDWADSRVCTTLWQWRSAPSRLYPAGQEPGFLALEGLSVQSTAALSSGDTPPGHPIGLVHTDPCGDSHEDSEVDESSLGNYSSSGKSAAQGSAAGRGEGIAGGGGRIGAVDGNRTFGAVTAVCDYHILYLGSYNVPVMSIVARHIDGRQLSWQEFVSCLPSEQRAAAESPGARWNMVTQQDHPVLRCPCFILHPCQTADLLDLMLPSLRHRSVLSADLSQPCSDRESPMGSSTEDVEPFRSRGQGLETGGKGNDVGQCWQWRYMRAWWSLVGPVVGLPQL